ncbi:MAG: biotin/lipoyl-binding protein, partial [Verrucomicrobiota bacterium]|nr:biotin/lipoyl-binding protein [Verrucomicrobiota bacterium]
MSNSIPNEIKLKKTSSYRARKIFEKWPILVWLGMLGLVLFLYSQRGVKVRINGMVTAHTEEISAPEDGVILKVLVKEGQKVSKGQELVTLDPSLLQKEIDDYKANLPFLRADMERKFKATRFGINADIQRAQSQKASAESRLETAKRNADLIKTNVENQLSLQSELGAALSKIDVIQTELDTHNKSIETLNADLKEADQLLTKVDSVNLPEELLVLKERVKNKTLVAPGEGTIFKLNKLGGVTQLGEPILTINLASPD